MLRLLLITPLFRSESVNHAFASLFQTSAPVSGSNDALGVRRSPGDPAERGRWIVADIAGDFCGVFRQLADHMGKETIVSGPEIDEKIPVYFRKVLEIDQRVLIVAGKCRGCFAARREQSVDDCSKPSRADGRGFPSWPISLQQDARKYRRYQVSAAAVWPERLCGRDRKRWRRKDPWVTLAIDYSCQGFNVLIPVTWTSFVFRVTRIRLMMQRCCSH